MANGERVSQRDIYDAVQDLRREIIGELKDVREDIEILKSFQNKAYGIFTVVSLFASGFFAWVWSKLTGRLT